MRDLRWEMMLWDGFGCWRSICFSIRKNARNAKKRYASKFIPDHFPLSYKSMYKTVKIYDRKLHKFVR